LFNEYVSTVELTWLSVW